MIGHWHAWKSTAAISFHFGTDWANAMLLPGITALKDGVHRSGFVFHIALHEGTYALVIAIGFAWADFPVILWGIGVDFRASASVSCQQFE